MRTKKANYCRQTRARKGEGREHYTANPTINHRKGLASHMMRKGQVNRIDGGDSAGQAKFVESLFRVGCIEAECFTTSCASKQSLLGNLGGSVANIIVERRGALATLFQAAITNKLWPSNSSSLDSR